MTPQLHIAGQTDVGQRRSDNQDTFISQQPLWSEGDALLAVIDGVGGYAGGDRAAEIARESIATYMAKPTGDTLMMLREAVVYANNQIVRHRQEEPKLAQMCCVLTVAVADIAAQRLLLVHVGDTRLYRFRPGPGAGRAGEKPRDMPEQLQKLTHDHSIVGVREDANQLTEREAMNHPRRNEILRDVGSTEHRIDDPDFLESDETDFLPGDVLLLCSDGLTDMLTRAQITDVLTQALSVEEQVAELIRRANEQGGQDNITVVLAQFPAPVDAVEGTEPVELPPPAPPTPTETAVPPVAARTTTRRRIIGLGLTLGSLLLLGLAWWSYQPNEAPKPVVSPSVTVRPDSSAGPRPPTTIPDSVRRP